MTTTQSSWMRLSHRLCSLVAVLLFSAIVLASMPAAGLSITYNLVNYPGSQTDTVNGGTDTISGTIVTNGTLGAWPFGPIHQVIGGTIVFQTPTTTYRGTYLDYGYDTTGADSMLTATTSQLLAYSGDVMDLLYQTPTGTNILLSYCRASGSTFYKGMVYDMTNLYAQFNTGATDSGPGNIGANNPWVVATAAPEPGMLVLLVTALLGLVAALFVRRRTRSV
jgi:hypothetical protein